MKTMITQGPFPEKTDKLQRFLFALFVIICLLFFSGCATVGHDFPIEQVSNIRIGKTSKNEVRAMFGEPWRVGLEDGQETWSYGKYRYTIFNEKDAKDLVIRFTDDNIVESYTFNKTNADPSNILP